MGRCRSRSGPVATPVTDLLVGQLHYRWPGHLGACWSSTLLQFYDLLLSAHCDLLAEDTFGATYFWIRPGPGPARPRSPLGWMVLTRRQDPECPPPPPCLDHQALPALVVEVRRGGCPRLLYGACAGPGCYDATIVRALHTVVEGLAGADRSVHAPRRRRG